MTGDAPPQSPAFNTGADEKINAESIFGTRQNPLCGGPYARTFLVSRSESNPRVPMCDFRPHPFGFSACVALAFAPAADRWPSATAQAAEAYAIAMHGAPALPADFTHMPYANPDAPKGGRLVLGPARAPSTASTR